MHTNRAAAMIARRRFLAAIGSALPVFLANPRIAHAQDKTGFPDGFDAVQAAPNSHKVIFENALVRVLEVTVPPPGTTEPMHHHRWPSFFLAWDTGGSTPHVRYLRPDGTAAGRAERKRTRSSRQVEHRMDETRPMHAIQTVDRPEKAPTDPPLLRVEIKCRS